MRLYIVRHGQSVENVKGPLPPGSNPPLTPLGQRQAAYAAGAIVSEGIDALYCGPLLRNVQTAAAIAEATGLSARIIPALYEVEADPVSCPIDVVERRFPFARAIDAFPARSFPYPESRDQAFARAGAVADWLRATHAHEDRAIGMVSHGTFTDFLLTHFLGLPCADAVRFSSGNCAIHALLLSFDRVKITRLNDESHIPRDERT